MKKHYILFLFLCAGVFLFNQNAKAQLDSTIKLANKNIVSPFVSDGQAYRAMVISGQNAEFPATFFSGTTYRVSVASGNTEGNVIFSVYYSDPATGERQLIYSNSQHNNASYWDFKVTSTAEVVIEASLNPASGKDSGFVIMAIGFKQ